MWLVLAQTMQMVKVFWATRTQTGSIQLYKCDVSSSSSIYSNFMFKVSIIQIYFSNRKTSYNIPLTKWIFADHRF